MITDDHPAENDRGSSVIMRPGIGRWAGAVTGREAYACRESASTRTRDDARRVTTVTNAFLRPRIHRPRRARAGRVLPGPADRAPGDHRDLFHGARPGPGRHAFLRLPVGGRRPGRRAEP